MDNSTIAWIQRLELQIETLQDKVNNLEKETKVKTSFSYFEDKIPINDFMDSIWESVLEQDNFNMDDWDEERLWRLLYNRSEISGVILIGEDDFDMHKFYQKVINNDKTKTW